MDQKDDVTLIQYIVVCVLYVYEAVRYICILATMYLHADALLYIPMFISEFYDRISEINHLN